MLRRRRAAAGLTQEEVAERAGVSARSIGDIERGVSRVPQRHTVSLLAEALGLTGEARVAFEASARSHGGRGPVLPAADTLRPPGASGPALVGRTDELALLERHLAGDGPPILLLAGEPGLGKTRLLAEAARYALDQGWSVLEGGCQRRGNQEPFAPLAGALTRFLSGLGPGALREHLRGCAWLVRLLPEVAGMIDEPLPGLALPPDQERRLVFAAVARLLGNVARRGVTEAPGGTLLVLDDLQWAGRDALELLTDLVGPHVPTELSAHHRPLRIVGAYRDTEMQPQDVLGVAVADWAHASLVTHRALGPLATDECALLLDELLAETEPDEASTSGHDALRERVLERAGGVPFFVVSYAQAVRQGDVRGGLDGVPWNVAQGVRQRVAALPEPARALLAAAAAVGRVSHPALLMAVAARPEEDVVDGLEAACQARLLFDAGQVYWFAHDVVREVIEGDIGSARRATLHRRAAQAIEHLNSEQLPDQYEVLADHYVRGEVWAKALHYLGLSGDKAVSSGAIRQALTYYDQALALCARLGTPAQETAINVAEKRGFVCYDSGDFFGAVGDFARMRTAAAGLDDRRREGLALAYGGMAAYYGHEFEAAEESLRAALAVANDGFDDVRLFGSIQLSSLYMVTDRHTEAAPLLRVAEELSQRVDDPLSRSWWAITGSEVLHWSGRYADALALLERWEGAVTSTNQLLVRLWTSWEAAVACGGKGDYGRALSLLGEVIAACANSGETFIRARALNTAGWIHCELQNHARALELNEESLALVGAIETADTEIWSNARLNLGDSYLALGRLDEAKAQFQAVERIVRNPRPQDRWMLWRYAQHLFHSYAELCLSRGDMAAALAYADECLARAEASDSPKNIAKACRLRGEVFLMRGQLAETETELDRALKLARRIGNPPQVWKTLVAVGDLQTARGSTTAALVAYGEAQAVVEDVAACLPDATLREIFTSSPHVQRIRQQTRGGSV
jgi:tetratricopeptide (TPR) repeat protein/transcriptional regulator with XRE-family HTH domain